MVQLHNIKITANTLSYVPFTLSTQWERCLNLAFVVYSSLSSAYLSSFLSGPRLCALSLCLVEHVTLHFVHCWCESFIYVFFSLSDSFDFQFGAVILRLKEGLDVSHIQGQGIKHMHTHEIVCRHTHYMGRHYTEISVLGYITQIREYTTNAVKQ